MNPSFTELSAAVCFLFALVHSLNIRSVERLASRYSQNLTARHLLSHLAEVEVVFGFWAIVYLILEAFHLGFDHAVHWFESLRFAEPLFVIVIMIIASTRPILQMASSGIELFAKALPFSACVTRYLSVLILGPLLGSLITEPAAMTVSAFLLHRTVLGTKPSKKLLYFTLATLFVNVSIGGLLTSFAAPPVLMVSIPWQWNTPYLFIHFGWKAILAVILNAAVCTYLNRKELHERAMPHPRDEMAIPFKTCLINLVFLAFAILLAHHPVLLIALFLILADYLVLTEKLQGKMNLKPAILVGFFLGGLVVLTAQQRWWLEPLISNLSDFTLYIACSALTAITDNAAITSLAAQLPNLAETTKQAVVAGAVVGGGLTVIANAPNPAGYSILKERFGEEGVSPGRLFATALIPTIIAGTLLWTL